MSNRSKIYEHNSSTISDKEFEQIALESELLEFRNAARKREEELITYAADNNSLRKKIQYTESELKSLQREHDILKKKCTSLEVSSKAATNTTDKSQEDQRELLEETKLLRMQSEKDAQVIADLKSKLEVALLDATRFRREGRELKTALKDSLKRNVALSEEAFNLQNSNSALMVKVSETSVQLDRLRNETISDWFFRTGQRDSSSRADSSRTAGNKTNNADTGRSDGRHNNNNNSNNSVQFNMKMLVNDEDGSDLKNEAEVDRVALNYYSNNTNNNNNAVSSQQQQQHLRPLSSGARPPRPLSSKFVREGSIGNFVDISKEIQTPPASRHGYVPNSHQHQPSHLHHHHHLNHSSPEDDVASSNAGSPLMNQEEINVNNNNDIIHSPELLLFRNLHQQQQQQVQNSSDDNVYPDESQHHNSNENNNNNDSNRNPVESVTDNSGTNDEDDMNDMNVYWQRPRTGGSVATYYSDHTNANSRVASANHRHFNNNNNNQNPQHQQHFNSSNSNSYNRPSSVIAHNVFTVVDDENYDVDNEIYEDEGGEDEDEENHQIQQDEVVEDNYNDDEIEDVNNNNNNRMNQNQYFVVEHSASPHHHDHNLHQQQQQQSTTTPTRQHVATYHPRPRVDEIAREYHQDRENKSQGREHEEVHQNQRQHENSQQENIMVSQSSNNDNNDKINVHREDDGDSATPSPTHDDGSSSYQSKYAGVEASVKRQQQQREFYLLHQQLEQTLQRREKSVGSTSSVSPKTTADHVSPASNMSQSKYNNNNNNNNNFHNHQQQHDRRETSPQSHVQGGVNNNNNNNNKSASPLSEYKRQLELELSAAVKNNSIVNNVPEEQESEFSSEQTSKNGALIGSNNNFRSFHNVAPTASNRIGETSESAGHSYYYSNPQEQQQQQQQQQQTHYQYPSHVSKQEEQQQLQQRQEETSNNNNPSAVTMVRMNRPGRAGARNTNSNYNSKYGASRGLPFKSNNNNNDDNEEEEKNGQRNNNDFDRPRVYVTGAVSASTPQPRMTEIMKEDEDRNEDNKSYHRHDFVRRNQNDVHDGNSEKYEKFPPGRLRPSSISGNNINSHENDDQEKIIDDSGPHHHGHQLPHQQKQISSSTSHYTSPSVLDHHRTSEPPSNPYIPIPSPTYYRQKNISRHEESDELQSNEGNGESDNATSKKYGTTRGPAGVAAKTRIPVGLPPLGLSAERAERLSARALDTPKFQAKPVNTGSNNPLGIDVKPSSSID